MNQIGEEVEDLAKESQRNIDVYFGVVESCQSAHGALLKAGVCDGPIELIRPNGLQCCPPRRKCGA